MTLSTFCTYLCARPSRADFALGETRTGRDLATLQRLEIAARDTERRYLAACCPSVPYGVYCEALTDWQCARSVFEEYLLSGRDLSDERAACESLVGFEEAEQ